MMKKCLNLFVYGLFCSSGIAIADVAQLSGPRLGVTMLTPGTIAKQIDTRFISQYGWQIETEFSEGDDFSGLVELVALAGGIDQGMFLPSISSLIGIRQDSGLEFALGPNLSLAGIGMVTAVGHSYKSGSFNIPVNLSWVMSNNGLGMESGHRISLTVGFTLHQNNS